MVLTEDQAKAYAKINEDDTSNFFLTGYAGSGKTTLLNHLLANDPDRYTVLASTGIAAVAIDGRTAHSFFGVGISQNIKEAAHYLRHSTKQLDEVANRVLNARTLVIDEISMIDADTLEVFNWVCQYFHKNDKPWGGLQIIFVGDFAQLPPVKGDYCFLSKAWVSSKIVPLILREIVRSDDRAFLKILEEIRLGRISNLTEKYLQSRVISEKGAKQKDAVWLLAKNAAVDRYNSAELNKLPGEVFHYNVFADWYQGGCSRQCPGPKNHECPEYFGVCSFRRSTPSETTRKQMYAQHVRRLPVAAPLILKKGAKVMFRSNDTKDFNYVNGTIGLVTDCNAKTIEVDSLKVYRQEYHIKNGAGRTTSVFTGYPLALAWAATIHKSQGRSLDCLVTDLSNLWEAGQAYVALSRGTNRNSVNLLGWSMDSIRISKKVRLFYGEIGV